MSNTEPAPRNRYRTSIIGLGVLVGLLACWLLSTVVPSLFLSSLMYSLALTLNALALVAAFGGSGSNRRAGIGYAACGWVYIIFAIFEDFDRPPLLVTSLILDSAIDPGSGPRSNDGSGGSAGQLIWAAHALIAVVAGMAGTWFAVRLPGLGPRPASPLERFVERPAPRQDADSHPLDRTD